MKKFCKSISLILLLVLAPCYAGQSPFPFSDLPRDLQSDIMVVMLNNDLRRLSSDSASFKIAVDKIRDLSVANKALNAVLNQPAFIAKLIKNLASKFNMADEIIAQQLGTKGAQERIAFQEEFIDAVLGYNPSTDKFGQFSQRTFDSFINKGADVNWVDKWGGTILSRAVQANRLSGVKALIKAGVDVNKAVRVAMGENTWIGGESALAAVATKNIGPEAGIKKAPISQVLDIIKVLLDAGADPEQGDVLMNIEKYSDRPAIVKAIKDAQVAKRAQQ